MLVDADLRLYICTCTALLHIGNQAKTETDLLKEKSSLLPYTDLYSR